MPDPTDILPRRGWRPAVYRRLVELIRTRAHSGAAAVFDFDNTCIRGDIGELFGHFLTETMRYRYDLDHFWKLVHPDDGRGRLRRLTERAMEAGVESAAYRRYFAEMAALYGRRLRRAGKRDCYEWAVRLHVGLTETQMRRWSAEAIRRELEHPLRTERLESDSGEVTAVERGIRPHLEIRELIEVLDEAGFDIWIVSASNAWTIRVIAPYFGVPEKKVRGNLVAVEEGRLSDATRRPVLYREGKAEMVAKLLDEPPDLVVGDAITDYEMLCDARDLALVIDRGDEFLRRHAEGPTWAMQPAQELTAEQPDPELLERLEV